MNNLLLLALFIASILLNVIDAVLTRTALRKGDYQELMRFTKRLIEELGVDKAMVVKSLLPVPLVILVILSWDTEAGLLASIPFIPVVIFYSYVVIQDCVQLLRKSQNKS